VWSLRDLQVVCGTMGMPTATVKLRGPDGMARVASAVGSGPVDASYKAIDSLVRVDAALLDYSVSSVTAGIEALATTRVRCEGSRFRVEGREARKTGGWAAVHSGWIACTGPTQLQPFTATLQVSIRPAGRHKREALVTNAQEITTARTFAGQGSDEDIVVSSARAYVSALNKMITFLSAAESAASIDADANAPMPVAA